MEKETEKLGWMKDFRVESRDMKLYFPALSSRFLLDVCRHVCRMLFIDLIFENVQCFSVIQKLRRVFISKRVTTTFKQSGKQLAEILKPS